MERESWEEERKDGMALCQFPGVSIAKPHQLAGLEQQNFIVSQGLKTRSTKSRCLQGYAPSKDKRGGSVPGPTPWPVDVPFSHCPLCVSVPKFPLFEDNSHIGLGPTAKTSFNSVTSVKTPFPNRAHSKVLRVRIPKCLLFWGRERMEMGGQFKL